MYCMFSTPLAELFELKFALYGLPVFMCVVVNMLTLITLHLHQIVCKFSLGHGFEISI